MRFDHVACWPVTSQSNVRSDVGLRGLNRTPCAHLEFSRSRPTAGHFIPRLWNYRWADIDLDARRIAKAISHITTASPMMLSARINSTKEAHVLSQNMQNSPG